MPRLVFVNRFYRPDQSGTARMLAGIATGLAEAGHDVTVITSRQLRTSVPDVKGQLAAEESLDGVQVVRVQGAANGGVGALSRLADYLRFHLLATWLALRVVRSGDVLIAKTDPPLLCVPMALVARVRRAVLINWTQDLFPEVAVATGLISKRSVFTR